MAAFGLRPQLARAHHDEKQRITDHTAYTMPQESFRIGIFRTDFAFFDSFSARTYIWPWLFRVPNLMLKWRPYGKDPWAFAIDTGFYHLDTRRFTNVDDEAGSAQLLALPFELISTFRFNEEHNTSASLVYTMVKIKGGLNGDAFNGAGQGAVENAQLTVTHQITFDEVVAVQLMGRMVLLQRFDTAASVTFQPDEYTTVEVFGGAAGEQQDLVGAGSVQADMVFSWKRTNLRLGLGYGHYNVPGINFVLPKSSVFPAFDLHWIFP